MIDRESLDAYMMRAKAIADIKLAEGARNYHTAKIMEMMGKHQTAELPGGGSYTWKTVNRKAYEVAATSYRDLRRHK